MKKLFPTLGLFLALGMAGNEATAQVYNYDFGTATGSHTSGISTSFLPAPPAGGGTARVRVGTGAAEFNLLNPGLPSLGSGSELQIVAPTGGSAAKFSIHDFTNSTSYVTVKAKMYIDALNSQTGQQFFFIGNGTNFSDNNTFISAQQFTGFQMILNTDNTVSVNLRTGGVWSPMGILLKQEEYMIEIYGNNALSTTAAVAYSRCGIAQSVAAGTLDIWINGTLVGNDVPKGALPEGTSPNSFMFYAVSASSPAFNTVVDDITYGGGLQSSIGVTASAAGTNPTTAGGTDGSATATVTTGTSPYTYSWNTTPAQTTATATGLAAGTYNVTVTDANGCSDTESVTLSDPAAAPLSVSITSSTNVNCFGQATGSATAAATGGDAPYSYSWNTTPAQASATATGLTAGTYTVTVTDDNGATASETISISQPATAVSATVAVQNSPVCNGESNGSALVAAFGGTPAYTYSWNTSPVQTAPLATGLAAGNYTVTVTDNNGCEATATTTVTDPAAVTATASSNSPVATGNTIMLSATGGTTYTWSGPDSFISYSQNPQITNAGAANEGTYSVTVANANGCTDMAMVSVTVTTVSGSSLTINQTAPASSTNFTSFAAAAAYLNTTGVSSATVIGVVSGTGPYTDQFILDEIPGASATNTVTINGNGNTLTHCGTSPANRDIIRLNGTDNITLNGLVLTASCTQAWGIHLMNGNENVTISNNTINLVEAHSIYLGSMNGIVAGNSASDPAAMAGLLEDISISGNTVNYGFHGIRINGNSVNTASDVTISGNTISNAVRFGVVVSYAQNLTVEQNIVNMRNSGAGTDISSMGVYLVFIDNGISVLRNRIINAGHMGLWLNHINRNSTMRGTVANNMIGGGFRNNNTMAVQFNFASNLDVYYNSVNADFGSIGIGMYMSNLRTTGLSLMNNSIAYTGAGANGRALHANDAYYNFQDIDYNNYWSSGGNFVYFNRGFRTDLAALQASINNGVGTHDINSMQANPQYVSATDLHIMATSPLRDNAMPLAALTVDFDGETRNLTTPDIGADEYMAGPPRFASNHLDLKVYPNPFGNELNLDVTGLEGKVQTELTDMMGRIVFSNSYDASAGFLQVRPQVNLPQGVYILKVSNQGTSNQFRVVKQ